MALLMIDLHGKRESALSNQMRQTKAMSPQYAIGWWKERDLDLRIVTQLNLCSRRWSGDMRKGG